MTARRAAEDLRSNIAAWRPASQARVVLQVILTVLAVGAGIWALYRLERVAFLLILTMFFAYLVAPLVRLVRHPILISGAERRVPCGLAIGIVYLLIVGAAAAGAAVLLPNVTQQISEAASQAPAYAESVRAWEQRWTGYYDRTNVPKDVRKGIHRSVVATGDAAADYTRGIVMTLAGSLSYVPWLVLIPILAFFLLRDAHMFRRAAITVMPHRFRLRGRHLFDELNVTMASYVRGQLLSCVFAGAICGVVFGILGVPYPALLGILAGVLEFIPLVGPFAFAAVATIVAALGAPALALWVIGFLMAFRMLQDYVVYPRLVGRGLRLHPLAVIVVVLAGLELDGVAGMFLAVPVFAVGSVVYRHWSEWRAGHDVGDEPVLRVAGAKE